MELCLTKILDAPGAAMPFETALDLSDLDFGGCKPADEPVRAVGQVKNTAGVLILTGTIETTLHCVCDRCCQPYVDEYVYDMEAVLTPALSDADNEDENIFELHGDNADLDEIVTTQFVLSMDPKMLCSEDCLGLCPRCGANLNDGPCSCKKEVDPRLAALAQLLKDKEV
jgi:uncharacterized protein